MNHETTIKRIQELVPEVMALEFGCEVEATNNFIASPDEYCDIEKGQKYMCGDHIWTNLYEARQEDRYKILGKPITLAVVLSALDLGNRCEENNDTENQTCWCLENTGQICRDWNLSKDNFNDQSEETKIFIGELINNNK